MYSRFLDYAQAKGMELLFDDKKFIKSIIGGIPQNLRRDVLMRYCEKWMLALGECESASCAQNLGRKLANNFLLQFNKEKRER